jgi:hypothetical protein
MELTRSLLEALNAHIVTLMSGDVTAWDVLLSTLYLLVMLVIKGVHLMLVYVVLPALVGIIVADRMRWCWAVCRRRARELRHQSIEGTTR